MSGGRQRLWQKRGMAEGTDRVGDKEMEEEKKRKRDTWERDRGVCERDKERRRRKRDTRERQRWERDGGSLEVQGARTPQLFWIPGKWGWRCPGMIPSSWNGSKLFPPPPSSTGLFCCHLKSLPSPLHSCWLLLAFPILSLRPQFSKIPSPESIVILAPQKFDHSLQSTVDPFPEECLQNYPHFTHLATILNLDLTPNLQVFVLLVAVTLLPLLY